MGKYDFLRTLNKEQLLGLREATDDADLLLNINSLLKNEAVPSYESNRKIYITDEKEEEYESIAKSLKIDDLSFFRKLVFEGKGNNLGSYGYYNFIDDARLLFDNEEVRKLANFYGIRRFIDFHEVYISGNTKVGSKQLVNIGTELKNSDIVKNALDHIKYFSYLDEFFLNERNIKESEGTYNSYMFIKEYIYQLLNLYPDVTVDELFSDFDSKKDLVIEYFQEICTYLYTLRESIPNARLSAFNPKISFASKYRHEKLDKTYSLFADMLAFGTTLEKLQNKNFEDYQRIIYVPQRTINK